MTEFGVLNHRGNKSSGNLTLLLGTGGVKFNLAGNLLISGSVLFRLQMPAFEAA